MSLILSSRTEEASFFGIFYNKHQQTFALDQSLYFEKGEENSFPGIFP